MIQKVLGETFVPNGMENSICNGRYLLRRPTGKGAFGEVYLGYDTMRKTMVAVKLEDVLQRCQQLKYEKSVYVGLKALAPFFVNDVKDTLRTESMKEEGNRSPISGTDTSPIPVHSNDQQTAVENVLSPNSSTSFNRVSYVPGFPRAQYYSEDTRHRILVMDLCGPNLGDLFDYCHRKFSVRTVLMLAEQMLTRIEYLHSRGFIHRDIKPENFVVGRGPLGHIIHLVDFGLAKRFLHETTGAHVPFEDNKPLTGTARYCSCNVHRGYAQSRRDDLEAIGFLFVYFLKGSLPWQGLNVENLKDRTIAIGKKKVSTPLEVLCKGLPSQFMTYLRYCRRLQYTEEPNYHYLRQIFRDLWKDSDFSNPSSGHDNGSIVPSLPPVSSPSSLLLCAGAGSSTFGISNGGSLVKKGTNIALDRPGSSVINLKRGEFPSGSSPLLDTHSKGSVRVLSTAPLVDLSLTNDQSQRNSSFRRAEGNAEASSTSRMSGPFRYSPSLSGVVLRDSRVVYDWHFDWFLKRYHEVQEYKAKNRVDQVYGSKGGGKTSSDPSQTSETRRTSK